MAKARSPKLVASKPTKIKWLEKPAALAQIYGSGLEYCFISKDGKQCCPFVYCKDFLQDAILAQQHGKNV